MSDRIETLGDVAAMIEDDVPGGKLVALSTEIAALLRPALTAGTDDPIDAEVVDDE